MSELGYTIFGQPFLGSGDNAGFLYVKPSFQVGIKGLSINKVHLARALLRSNLKWTTARNMFTCLCFCSHTCSVCINFLNVHVFCVRLLLSSMVCINQHVHSNLF